MQVVCRAYVPQGAKSHELEVTRGDLVPPLGAADGPEIEGVNEAILQIEVE